MRNSFIILSYGHSATSSIRNNINQHPDIHCFGEVFNKNYNYAGFKYKEETLKTNCLETYIKDFLSMEERKKIIGCNLHFPHINFFKDTNFLENIENNFSKIIILKRNPLFVFFKGTKSIVLNPKKFELFLKEYEDTYEKCKLFSNHIEIKYEDYINNIEETINNVFDYINVKKFKIINFSKRRNSANIKDRIENFLEVERYLRDGKFI